MTKVQKKSSLCNEKNQCTCKSFNELQKIDLIIAEMEKTTVGQIPSKTGMTSDKIRMIHGFIKKMINAAAVLADQKKQLNENLELWMRIAEHWQDEKEEWRLKYLELTEQNKIADRGTPSKIDSNRGEGKIIPIRVNNINSL